MLDMTEAARPSQSGAVDTHVSAIRDQLQASFTAGPMTAPPADTIVICASGTRTGQQNGR